MKKLVLFAAFLLIFSGMITAQVAINTTGDNPDPSAILDLQSTTKGFLVPRVTSAERNLIGTTQSGLLVYDLTTESFWYYDNTQAGWIDMGSGPGAASINDLSDAISDNTSVFLGSSSGINDDGSSNLNAAVGISALQFNTSGHNNTAMGYNSLKQTTTGSANSAFGYKSMENNTTGAENVAIGESALFYNSNGHFNTTIGSLSLYNNIAGSNNTSVGYAAGYSTSGTSVSGCVYLGNWAGGNNTNSNKLFIDNSNTSTPLIGGDFSTNRVDINGTIKISGGSPGANKVLTSDADGLASWESPAVASLDDLNDAISDNTSVFLGSSSGINDDGSDNKNAAVGINALQFNTSGGWNTAMGYNSLNQTTGGGGNCAFGYRSMENNTIGQANVAVGESALFSNIGGINNTAIGSAAAYNHTANNTTAIGYYALFNNTTGSNTAVGANTMRFNTTGTSNVGLGSYVLYYNETGNNNTAIGNKAGYGTNGTSISGCVFIGYSAGENNTTDNKLYIDNSNTSTPLIGGDFSTNQVDINGTIKITGGSPGANKVLTSDASGLASWTTPTSYASSINDLTDAIYDNTSLYMGYLCGANDDGGNYNLGIGREALTTLTTGLHNTAVGYKALATCNSDDNTAVGINALRYTTTGTQNTSMGMNALQNNTIGSYNTGVGYEALKTNTEGSENTAFGQAALYANTTGASNAAFGFNANYNNTTGLENTSLGGNSLYSNTTGGGNVAIGYGALEDNITGHWNTAVGHGAYVASGSYLNSTAIGYNSPISGSNQIHLGNTSITEIKGQVNFTAYSDGRIKENVKEDVCGLGFILKLRPITYNINLDKENLLLGIGDDADLPNKYDIEKVRKTGFIAQEVEAAANEVDYDFSGIQKPKHEQDLYGLSYSEFVVPLVKSVQELNEKLEKENAELKARIEKLEQLLIK
ncbi:MAG: tail fiber domain-containing protein [Bacteroidetes bacterium]|nr:tail fiber domain-containing protein [Bacteroidota bacterium]